MYRLSIVIPVLNNYTYTRQAIDDLLQLPEDHRIIIVDNASSDNTKNIKDKPRLVVQRNKQNLGFAKACNIGYKFAKEDSEHVMFLNNDIRVRENHNNWTEKILEASVKSDTLVGPTVGILDSNFNFVKEAGELPSSVRIGAKFSGYYYMSGWNVTASVETWKKLIPAGDDGPFSSEFGIAYFEDTDLGMRSLKQGMRFEVVPVPVHHFGQKTTKTLNLSGLYNQAKQIFVAKWKGNI